MIISYRTDREALKRIVPEPLEFIEAVVRNEFIRMPNSTGFGTYAGSAQVVPVRFRGEMGGYTHAMFLDAHEPVAGSFGASRRSSPLSAVFAEPGFLLKIMPHVDGS
jgi:acetoacetate decarboxylase